LATFLAVWVEGEAINRIAQNPGAPAREVVMKLQRQLFAIALLLTSSMSGLGAPSAEQKRERLRLLRGEEVRRMKLTPLDRAYLDARALLGQPGACREFYGPASERVLEELVIELREERMSNASIGIRMSGPFTSFANAEEAEGISYRLFARAELNTEGPFCKAKVFTAEPLVPNVGSFRPNTREVRVLILLHELAHLIQGRNGRWLIPDDGGNPQLSRQNTNAVESRCGKQIRAL
jgi:hypothetical protein